MGGRSLFGRGSSARDVKAGTVFCRTRRYNLVETARVLSVSKDPHGIPHVRFEVSFSQPSSNSFHDARVLALESFARQYPERV